jgi:hypothetical protein
MKNVRSSRSTVQAFPRTLCIVALVASVVTIASTGCAASQQTSEGGSDYYAIKVDSVDAPSSYNDGYDLVRSVRPGWFREAGGFTVYLGKTPRSDAEAALREVQVSDVSRIRYYREVENPPNFVDDSSLPALVVELGY